MALLNRDGIKVEEVADYHIYPIADNDTPCLSSDRLEYTLSNGLGATEKIWTLDDVKEIYLTAWKQGHLDEAIEELEEAVNADYRTTQIYQNLGILYNLSDDHEKALKFNL